MSGPLIIVPDTAAENRRIAAAKSIAQRWGMPATRPHSNPRGARKNAYAAALVNRLTEDWPVSILSADAAARWSLTQLRARSRGLERNGGILERYLSALEANVIGSQGVGLQMKVREAADRTVTDPAEKSFLLHLQKIADLKARSLGATKSVRLFIKSETGDLMLPQGAPDRYANALLETEWNDFGKRGNFEVTKKHSRQDFWRLTLRTAARDGDALLLVYRGYANRWNCAFQLIEGDYIDELYNVERLPNGNRIRMGVELDRFRRKVAVWVFATHPGDYGTEGVYTYDGRRLRIPILGTDPAAPVLAIHVSRGKRAEETRPVPWITPAMLAIQMLEGYEEAELVAARSQACKHVFYERDEFASDGTPLDYQDEDDNGQLVEDFQPGGSTELPKGYHANFYDPTHPNAAFPDFVKSIKRKISSALNCAYNTLFVDLESVNYSSIRAGLLDEREEWKMKQSWFGDDVVTPSFDVWLELQLLGQTIPFPMSQLPRLNQPEFKFRRWPWVDPKNDAQTAELLLKNKLTTRSRLIHDMSSDDFEDTIDELDYEAGYILEKDNLKELGDQEKPAPGAGPVPGEPPDPADKEDPEGDKAKKSERALNQPRIPGTGRFAKSL